MHKHRRAHKCTQTHTRQNTAADNLICAQRVLCKEEWESSITLPPLTISQGVLKSNVFSNAGLRLVAGPSWP